MVTFGSTPRAGQLQKGRARAGTTCSSVTSFCFLSCAACTGAGTDDFRREDRNAVPATENCAVDFPVFGEMEDQHNKKKHFPEECHLGAQGPLLPCQCHC